MCAPSSSATSWKPEQEGVDTADTDVQDPPEMIVGVDVETSG